MSAEGLVFSIEEFSVFDGPGIRTSVFLKGCPLSCSWCHNPEGQSFQPEIVKSPNGCSGCGACIRASVQETGKTDLSLASVAACPQNLIRVAGERYSAEALCEKLLKNRVFYQTSGGGVTFSGGEPLAQPDFLLECLTRLDGLVHRGVQTTGFCPPDLFSRVLTVTDLMLFDIKLVNKTALKRYTGADSRIVYRNFETLIKSKKTYLVRIPLIPGVTDTKENIEDIIALLKSYGISYAEAMPYNPMAGAKYPLVGKTFTPDFDPQQPVHIPTEEFRANHIELRVL